MNSDTALQQSSSIERLILRVKIISGLGAIARNETFFRAGLSSIMLTHLKQTVENDFGVEVPVRLFYDRTDTVEKLARYVLENVDGDSGLPGSGAMGPEEMHHLSRPNPPKLLCPG